MNIAANISEIKKTVPATVKIVAVSKTKPFASIIEAYDGEHRIFGENKVQELVTKYETLPKDIEWHMIGHLQTNKVKYIVPFVSLIHGVDSFKLMEAIDREAKKVNRKVSCLLQFYIASETTKFGFTLAEAKEMLNSTGFRNLEYISVRGVMGMATFTDDSDKIRAEFRYLKSIFDELKISYFQKERNFSEISMGMSDDYQIAIEEGSTIVRIGSRIFGERITKK